MKIIICLDPKGGIIFNNRRQSRDSAVCERILALAENNKLFMNEYSAKLFETRDVIVDNEFLAKAQENDYCFVESDAFLPYLKDIKGIVVYRWDKAYPADVTIDATVLQSKCLVKSTEFEGSSHKIITEEIYE